MIILDFHLLHLVEPKQMIQTCMCPACCPKCSACSLRMSCLYGDFHLSKETRSWNNYNEIRYLITTAITLQLSVLIFISPYSNWDTHSKPCSYSIFRTLTVPPLPETAHSVGWTVWHCTAFLLFVKISITVCKPLWLIFSTSCLLSRNHHCNEISLSHWSIPKGRTSNSWHLPCPECPSFPQNPELLKGPSDHLNTN